MYIHEVMTNNTEILPSNTTVMETAKKNGRNEGWPYACLQQR